MLNSLAVYHDAGAKYAKAVNVSDGTCAAWWRDWINRAIACEHDADKGKARAAYRDGYSANRSPSF
jgi:hypothetical protein